VTAITRVDSSSVIPDGVKVAKVNYDDQSSLVTALQGQDVLIITMSVSAPKDQQMKLVDAAAEAGVPWVFPNTWGFDLANESFSNDAFLGPGYKAIEKRIEDAGKSSWIGIVSGFWYEFSLGGSADRYGFDFENQTVVFVDDGNTLINTSTWPQSGRAVANLLALKTYPDGDDDKSITLSSFKNKFVYMSSFCISQKDMFDSVLRVTNTKAEDWKISYENSKERYDSGIKLMKEGNMAGFARAMYTRGFYPDGSGNFEKTKGIQNDVLGLPKEDLDEFTKIAIERSGSTYIGGKYTVLEK
jgi:hypothetical protein